MNTHLLGYPARSDRICTAGSGGESNDLSDFPSVTQVRIVSASGSDFECGGSSKMQRGQDAQVGSQDGKCRGR